jgi:osomolarity two-component system, phosphorelay intermediate protein YPD1
MWLCTLWTCRQVANAAFRKQKNLTDLSQLGHFLKGSSATLGLNKVRDSCEKIQHYGAKKDESGQRDITDVNLCLDRLKDEIAKAKDNFAVVEKILKRYYGDQS